MSTLVLERLEKHFSSDIITRQQFREYISVSVSTDCRLYKNGRYPRVIKIGGNDRILLCDLAAWLESDSLCHEPKLSEGKKVRGRPKGTRNKQIEMPHTPALPYNMAVALGIPCTQP